jgi:hypothetical protein
MQAKTDAAAIPPQTSPQRIAIGLVAIVVVTSFLAGLWLRGSSANDNGATDSSGTTRTARVDPAFQFVASATSETTSTASIETDRHTFHGYVCTVDCSGHKIGFSWAKERGITDPGDCPPVPHNLQSLEEGCWAAAGRPGP